MPCAAAPPTERLPPTVATTAAAVGENDGGAGFRGDDQVALEIHTADGDGDWKFLYHSLQDRLLLSEYR